MGPSSYNVILYKCSMYYVTFDVSTQSISSGRVNHDFCLIHVHGHASQDITRSTTDLGKTHIKKYSKVDPNMGK